MLNLGWDKKPGRLSGGLNSYIHIIEKNGVKRSRQLVPFFFSLKVYKNAGCFMDKPYIKFSSRKDNHINVLQLSVSLIYL